MEAEKGTLEDGKRADLVVLDANPLTVDPASLSSIKVKATLKDGELVFGKVGG